MGTSNPLWTGGEFRPLGPYIRPLEVPLPSIEVSRVFPATLSYMLPIITTAIPAAACPRFFAADGRIPLVEAGSPTATVFPGPLSSLSLRPATYHVAYCPSGVLTPWVAPRALDCDFTVYEKLPWQIRFNLLVIQKFHDAPQLSQDKI